MVKKLKSGAMMQVWIMVVSISAKEELLFKYCLMLDSAGIKWSFFIFCRPYFTDSYLNAGGLSWYILWIVIDS